MAVNPHKTEKTLELESPYTNGNAERDEVKTDNSHILESDPKIEARILRKCDIHILPWLFGIWLCAFIDRSNIGNARIDGLTTNLHLKGNQFNVALGKFSHY